MAVLITGGAGYIGSHMVWEMLDRGETPIVLDNLSTGFRWAVPDGVPLVVGDTGDVELVDRVIDQYGIDAIIHFAAKIVVPESVADPLAYYHNNTVKSRSLIATAVRRGVRNIIFSSTAAVYGNPDSDRLGEDDRLSPVSPYGSSKLMTEMMLRDVAAAHDLRYAVLRYFNVAGADPAGRTGHSAANATHLIKIAVQTVLGLRPFMEVYGQDYPTRDGSCIRDYVHVSDLARAHSAALDHLRAGGESLTCNCGYGRGYTVWEVIDAVRRVSGTDFEVRRGPRRPGDPAVLVAAVDRIRDRLGWQGNLDDLDTIVGHALRWERHLVERGHR
jgi:UDP-glucose 4-epimerase